MTIFERLSSYNEMMALIFGLFLLALFVVAIAYLFLGHSEQPTTPFVIPFNNQFCEVRGHKIHYTQQGRGKDVLLLHGIGASQLVWRFLVPKLAPFFRVTTMDILGFGMSDKPEDFSYGLDSQCEVVLEFMHKVNIKKALVVGSSMGGTMTLALSERNPEMFPAIVVISPAYDPQITYFDLNRIAFLTPMVKPLITQRFIKQVMKRVYSDHSLISPETIAAFSRPYESRDAVDAFAKSFRLLRDSKVYDELPNIQSRTLILWGMKDKIVPVKFAQKIHKRIPHSMLEIHPSAGHHVHEDAPEWTFEKIRLFFMSSL